MLDLDRQNYNKNISILRIIQIHKKINTDMIELNFLIKKSRIEMKKEKLFFY